MGSSDCLHRLVVVDTHALVVNILQPTTTNNNQKQPTTTNNNQQQTNNKPTTTNNNQQQPPPQPEPQPPQPQTPQPTTNNPIEVTGRKWPRSSSFSAVACSGGDWLGLLVTMHFALRSLACRPFWVEGGGRARRRFWQLFAFSWLCWS